MLKLIEACLAGLMRGILSGRLRADGKIVLSYLLVCVVTTMWRHNPGYFDSAGLIAIIDLAPKTPPSITICPYQPSSRAQTAH